MPIYEIAADGATGHRTVSTSGAALVVAEGIFADQIVGRLRDEDLLAGAVCVQHHPLVTLVRPLCRDLREGRSRAGTGPSRAGAPRRSAVGTALRRREMRAVVVEGGRQRTATVIAAARA